MLVSVQSMEIAYQMMSVILVGCVLRPIDSEVI